MNTARAPEGYFTSGGPRVYEQPLKLNAEGVSAYPSVNRYLERMKRRGSMSTLSTGLLTLARLVEFAGLSPDELIALEPVKAAGYVQGYCDRLSQGGHWQAAKTSAYRLLGFFKANRVRLIEELDVDYRGMKGLEHVPSKEDVRALSDVWLALQETAQTALRNRAIILTLYTSGLRNSTLRALTHGMVKDQLAKGEDPLRIHVSGELRRVDPDACKEGVEYWTFATEPALEALKAYLKDRVSRRGPIADGEPLFTPEGRNLPPHMLKRPIAKPRLSYVVKEAAKRGGVKDWKAVRAHSLRKTFRHVLDAGYQDGGQMAEDDKEYLMGHRLPGQKQPYHNANVQVLAERYMRLNWSLQPPGKALEEENLELKRRVAELETRLDKLDGVLAHIGFEQIGTYRLRHGAPKRPLTREDLEIP